MINKGRVFALAALAPVLALVPVSAIAGEGPGEIVEQGQNLLASAQIASAQVGGAQIYECVESDGKSVCKFRLLSMRAPVART